MRFTINVMFTSPKLNTLSGGSSKIVGTTQHDHNNNIIVIYER